MRVTDSNDFVALVIGLSCVTGAVAFIWSEVFTEDEKFTDTETVTIMAFFSGGLTGGVALAKGGGNEQAKDTDVPTPSPTEPTLVPPPTDPTPINPPPVPPPDSFGEAPFNERPVMGFGAVLTQPVPQPRFTHGYQSGCWARGMDV